MPADTVIIQMKRGCLNVETASFHLYILIGVKIYYDIFRPPILLLRKALQV